MAINDMQVDSTVSPIYPVTGLGFENGVCAAFTGRGISIEENHNFSFHRPPRTDHEVCERSKHFGANVEYLATHCGFDARLLTWPNGAWPHSGQVIIAEDYKWVPHTGTSGVMPVTKDNEPVTYDGIVTRSRNFVLGVQGADCSSIFLYDAPSGVIGLVHAGWKPVVRGVVKNAIEAMKKCGADPDNIVAYISPGIGDQFFEFQWDDAMEQQIRDIFIQAGREEILTRESIRHQMTDKERMELASALGRDISDTPTFKLGALTNCDLQDAGVGADNILQNFASTTVDRHPSTGNTPGEFQYHSYRREKPNHGLSMSVLFLKSEQNK